MTGSAAKTILILGGYGVFGGYLAARLLAAGQFNVIVAGRSRAKAETFCAKHGGQPAAIDLGSEDLADQIAAHQPFIIVDAAGPYQAYGSDPYRVPRAAIACGAHYLDLSDDAAFTVGISALDGEASAAGVAVISGVSSVPALSSAIIDHLSDGLSRIDLIECAILPGNRAPRGLSVMQSVLGQAGQPIQMWRDGRWTTVKGWGGRKVLTLKVPGKPDLKRAASYIGAPDLSLFPDHYSARSVVFRAGLELPIMHDGLGALSGLVRLGAVRSLAGWASFLKWWADRLEGFGTDRGGMIVRVVGRARHGSRRDRTWTLIVGAGDGPQIPAVPARILIGKLAAGETVRGAYPALGVFTRAEAEAALSELSLTTHAQETAFKPLFEEALSQLPEGLSDLHDVVDCRNWSGRASVRRGSGFMAKLLGTCLNFPPCGNDVEVTVRMQRRGLVETWERSFGGKRFRSHLSLAGPDGSGRVSERFGLLAMELGLFAEDETLHFPVRSGRFLGIPLPRFVLPRSDTREYVDAQGRACFDVNIAMPVAGHVVSYKGWLEPVSPT